jgi:biotin-(acetyl-CoA carboxylase) ligase
MPDKKKSEDLSGKIKVALDKAIKKVIAEEKARDGYLVVADKDGKIKKIPASEL